MNTYIHKIARGQIKNPVSSKFLWSFNKSE